MSAFHRIALLLALAILPAAAYGQDRAIRAGTYDLSVTYGGGQLAATLDIQYRRDSLVAVLKLGEHESPVRAGKRQGTKLQLEPVSAAMDVRYDLEFNADAVKGTFIFQGQGGEVSGTRRRTAP